jgi:hypothetical protein
MEKKFGSGIDIPDPQHCLSGYSAKFRIHTEFIAFSSNVEDSFLTECLCTYRGKYTLTLAVSPDGILLASGDIIGEIIAVFEIQVTASPFHLHTKRGLDSRYVGSMIRPVETDHLCRRGCFLLHSRE